MRSLRVLALLAVLTVAFPAGAAVADPPVGTGPLAPVWISLVDPIVCPIVGGDVPMAEDCPPYGSVPPCATVLGQVVCASYTTGPQFRNVDVYGPTATPRRVAGYVDVYAFTVVGTVNVPCVVLVDGSTTTDPCATAGGTFVSRLATLADRTVDQPGPPPGPALGSVAVCDADLVLTVDNLGIASFPGYALC